MQSGKGDEGKRKKQKARNMRVLSCVHLNDISDLVEFFLKLKTEDQIAFDMDQMENLTKHLVLLSRSVDILSTFGSLDSLNAKMSRNAYEIQCFFESLFNQIKDDKLHNYDEDIVIFRRFQKNNKIYIDSKSSATMDDEQLLKLLDSLLVNLHDQSSYDAEMFVPLMNQYKVLQNVCGNLRDFLGLKVNGCIEHEIVEYILPQIQLMAERVGHFCSDHWSDQLDEIDMPDEIYEDYTKHDFPQLNLKLAHLLVKIIPVQLEVMHICCSDLKASTSTEVSRFIKQLRESSPDILREYLIHLQEHMVGVLPASTSARNIHVVIEFLLVIFTDMPKDFIHHDKLFELLARVGELTREITILVHNLEEKSRKEENTNNINCATLLDNIELLKGDLKHIYLKVPDSSHLHFPMTDGPLFMNLLLINLNDLLNSNAYSVALIKKEIRLVKEDLEFIRSFFGNVEQELNKDLWRRVLNVAYEAEHVINSILVRDHGLLQLIFLLPDTINKIKLIKEEIPEKIPKNRGLDLVNLSNKPKRQSLTVGQTIVGFKEETKSIIRKLTFGSAELVVISIIGMPGLGKTTLAYRVYNDESVASHFDVRAWCTVDQEKNEKKLLQKIFNQVIGLSAKDSDENIDANIADKLRKQLFGKRYLIVLDDLWDIATWDELARPFPEVKKGSRIIITSRKKEVALQGALPSDPLYLRLFRQEECLELLMKRVFGEESCPDELLDVGKEIAQNCRGLPLVADLIAGVIARKEKKKTLWLEVLNNLNSFIFENDVEVMKVIQLSYDHLPDHLKPCFLYLGSYPKDKQIEVSELKSSWLAEGLVEQTEMKRVEDAMEVYLDNLISSSLVIAGSEMGKHQTCQIHDLVHDFCLIKARKEMLFDWTSSSDPSSALDLVPRRMTIHHDEHLPHSYKNSVMFDSEKKRHSAKYLLSLKTDGFWNVSHSDIYHLRHLRLLRVLCLPFTFTVVTDSVLNEIGMLIHLRYLELATGLEAIPSSFSNLMNLETLVMGNMNWSLVLVPIICKLAKLRRLSIHTCSLTDLDRDSHTLIAEDRDEHTLLAEDSKLEKLRILESLQLSYWKDTGNIFKRFPNLQQLKCEIVESWDSSAECNWFPKLDVLNELEVLRVHWSGIECGRETYSKGNYSIEARDTSAFHVPSSLKSLELSCNFVTSDTLLTIASLPNLEELSIACSFIQGNEWNIRDDAFKNLKYLKLQSLYLSTWQVGDESFPVLEQLILWDCPKLKDIPSTLGDITSLKSILLIRCPHLEDSALEIKQYIEDMTGEDTLKVVMS